MNEGEFLRVMVDVHGRSRHGHEDKVYAKTEFADTSGAG